MGANGRRAEYAISSEVNRSAASAGFKNFEVLEHGAVGKVWRGARRNTESIMKP